MKCSSRLVRPCTSSSVGPLGSPQQFTGKSPQGALAAWGKGRDRGEVDPTQLGGFNLFLTAAGGTSSRLVPKRHLITLPRVQVIYIRLPTTAAAPRSSRAWVSRRLVEIPRRHQRDRDVEVAAAWLVLTPRGPRWKCRFVWSVSRENNVCVCVCVPESSVCPHSCCAPCRPAANPLPPSYCNRTKMAGQY